MTWSDPVTGSAFFDTDDVPTEGNFDTYVFNNLLALPHPIGSREYAEKGVQNSTAETSLFTTPPVIPGGALGSTGSFEVFLWGRIRQGTTAGMNWTWRFKLGGTSILTGVVPGLGSTDASDFDLLVRVWLEALGSESSQRIMVQTDDTGSRAGVVTGTGTSAIDLTVDQSFDITVQMASAGADDLVFKKFSKQLLGRN